MNGTLYVVATPIGNMDDITIRAINILKEVDIIAAEDTRNTLILLKKLNINNTKLIANHKFNEKHQCDFFINQLLSGKNIAIVSDAGTPCISDPGCILVNSAIKNNIKVVGISGASAVITGISISGFNALSFAFYGFLPRTNSEIKEAIEKIKDSSISVSVFYESPLRIKKTMRLICEIFPNSEICLCNDMTKMYERIYRGTPTTVLEELNNNQNSEKGEYTLIINNLIEKNNKPKYNEEISLESKIVDYMIKNSCTVKDSIKEISKKDNISKNELYNASLHLKEVFSYNNSNE